ncbi:hypothetical protein [Nocardioides aquiterrae]|uniref:Uncharacterized protein n=1 Tax=Nocardioides aquiterrae TaxID=203799 RepID=A0ABN1UJJ6_9ACTN
MSTDRAQRRLADALGALDQVDGGIVGLFAGLDVNIPVARAAGLWHLAEVYAELRSVAEGVLAGDERLASAQRRLLEALSALDQTPGGIAGLQLGLAAAIPLAEDMGSPEMANVYRAVDLLAASVHDDLTEKLLDR